MRRKHMAKEAHKQRVVQSILKDVREELLDDALIHRILHEKVSKAPDGQNDTLGQRAADKLAAFAGSWLFLFTFIALLLGWMIVNTVLAARAFDPYPYILLNLVLSCLSAIQAPILMMSQNRQSEKDRLHAENDFQVNLKTEFIIEDLHHKLEESLKNQQALQAQIKALSEKLDAPTPMGENNETL